MGGEPAGASAGWFLLQAWVGAGADVAPVLRAGSSPQAGHRPSWSTPQGAGPVQGEERSGNLKPSCCNDISGGSSPLLSSSRKCRAREITHARASKCA